jgi:hypothetical protein
VGHRAFDRALAQAREYGASAASLPANLLARPLIILSVVDRVTTESSPVRSVVVGVEVADAHGPGRLLTDWELLQRLNGLLDDRVPQSLRVAGSPPEVVVVRPALDRARRLVEDALPSLDLPFRTPAVEGLAVLWPTVDIPRIRAASSAEPS